MENNNSNRFNAMEQEIIILKAILDMIDEMVNYEIFEQAHGTKDVALMFKTRTHQKFFNIQLVDFLSRPREGIFDLPFTTEVNFETDKSFLYYLEVVCNNPNFGKDEVNTIRQPIMDFKSWLETDCQVKDVWLPSIDKQTDIKVKRISFIKICGNISKHNFTRLDRNVSEIKNILLRNDVKISDNDAYLVLPEFYEWFHGNIFNYHSSAIAEFLNNIRWGIYEYLQPEFRRSFTPEEPGSIAYRFVYPEKCTNSFAKEMYWNLMNAVRRQPYMPKFEVMQFLKMQY